jgi:predicted phosphodiesterase
MKKLFVIPDIHSPFHDRLAMRLTLLALKEFKPDIVVQLGDLIDCYSLSSFSIDPLRRKLFKDEVETTNDLLDKIDCAIQGAEKYVTLGNHEERFDRYLQGHGPSLCGLSGLSIPELLKLRVRGWKVTQYKDFLRLGKAIFTHDLDYGYAGVARKALHDAQHTVVVGHAHRIETVVEGDATGTAKFAACFGWLGDPNYADYKHRLKANRDWAQGFGIGYMQDGGTVHFQAVPIVYGSCVIEGELLRVK